MIIKYGHWLHMILYEWLLYKYRLYLITNIFVLLAFSCIVNYRKINIFFSFFVLPLQLCSREIYNNKT